MARSSIELERLLPELRRYAFQLTGARRTGDDLVEACIRAAMQSPEWLDPRRPRQSLYRLFHQIHPSVPIGAGREEGLSDIQDRMLNYLLGLPLPDRAILALHSSMAFEDEEIADILDLPHEEVRANLVATRQRLARAELARILIIEDDYILASDIAYAIEQGGQGVCGPAATYAEAIRCATEDAPGLVLADVQLRDGRFAGIEAADAIAHKHGAPVIFITAYPERVVLQAALRPCSVLTKPIDYRLLRSTIARSLAAPA